MIRHERTTYFSPADDTVTAFLAFIGSAKASIRIADYSFNLSALVELLVAMHQSGVDVALVLDRSQAAGPTERPQIARLREAGVPLVIGTSDHHQIMHCKFAVVDGEWVQWGSWNYTASAADQDNVFDIEHDPYRAGVFTAYWQSMWDWISAHEPQSGGPA